MQIHILVSSGGDSSFSLKYITDVDVLKACKLFFEDSENNPGVDGDGFHYDTLNIPDGVTVQSLGISRHQLITKKDMLEYYDIDVDTMTKNS